MTHRARDRGDGVCSDCPRPVATYPGRTRIEHRRGRRAGVTRARPRCRRCRSLSRPLRVFRLLSEHELAAPSRAVVRRPAGSTLLCEPCWRVLTAAIAA